MIEPSKVELEILKVSKYKGRLVTMYFRIHSCSTTQPHTHIPYEWIHGSIRLDMTRMFSATFQRWFDLTYNEADHLYQFYYQGKQYDVVDEIIHAASRINTEHFLLDKIP